MISKPEKFLMLIGSEFNVPCPNMPKIDLKNPNPGLSISSDVEGKLREIFGELLKDEVEAYKNFSIKFNNKINDQAH